MLARRSSVVERRKSQMFGDEPIAGRSGSLVGTPTKSPNPRRLFDKRNSLRFAIPASNGSQKSNDDVGGGEEIEMGERFNI